MNEQAAKALYEAERKGVKQIKGRLVDSSGGLCALGVIDHSLGVSALGQVNKEHAQDPCPFGCTPTNSRGVNGFGRHALYLLAHLNDDHDLTFSEIARKLGPDTV